LRAPKRPQEHQPIQFVYFAPIAGTLPTLRASCWITTVALNVAAIFFSRYREAIVWARSELKDGTPPDS
jgi:hypothetical protein